MKAIVFERFGEPAEVLQVREVPTPEPGPGEVRVRMIASPVNPSDLLFTRGRYVFKPDLPATPGFEGVGVVDKVGPGINPLGWLVKGKRVLAINHKGGNWAEYAVIPSRQARPMPADLPDEQVATAFVNPVTVLAMVRHELGVAAGGWLLQSAATSALGKMIIKLGRHDGFKTVNVVRRAEAVPELKALGADAVVVSTEGPIDEQVRKVVGSEGVKWALDPVGGETGTQMFRSLAPEGMLIVYGSLTPDPIQVDPRAMISARRLLRGFWLGNWMRQQSIPKALRVFGEAGRLIRDGVLATEIGPTFRLEQVNEAVRQAEVTGKSGKVLLRIGAKDGER